jgi:ubiquinol-cytochrome c reductase cytochrome c1 subunit
MIPMLRKTALAALVALTPSLGLAAGEGGHIEDVAFPFEGPFGSYDQMQLQRGLQVFTEICSGCHGLKFVPIRTLHDEGGPGLPEDQVRAYAKNLPEIDDAETGEPRAREWTDHFPESALEQAPDLSLMAKARAGFHGPYGLGLNQLFKGIGGPEYIVAILNGYEEAPACAPDNFAGYYNTVFASGGYPDSCKNDEGHHTTIGSWIAMAPPLDDGLVEFADGHPNDLHATSEDVAAFLMWTAEPKLNARKEVGFIGVIFLAGFAVLLYLTNKKLWAPIKRRGKDTPLV